MRVDSASRRIAALREEVFRAFTDPGMLASWLPPEGMTGHLEHIDARAGGGFRMVLTYECRARAAERLDADSDVTDDAASSRSSRRSASSGPSRSLPTIPRSRER